jgi:tripartite-type tricarboxylate transporter receptor subunit TctC
VHVPYRGAAPAVNDLLGQQVQMTFLDLPVLLPQVKAGALRPIAIGAPERAPTAMEVPTTAEAGMPGMIIENWYGMVAPAATPPAIIAQPAQDHDRSDGRSDREGKARAQGATLVGDTPEHFRGFIDSEIRKWAKVIKDAGVVTTK